MSETPHTPPPTEAPARPIRLWLHGQVRAVTGVAPTLSLLDWLREHQRATGTKEGCNEGDCGACTVLVVDLAGVGPAAPGESRVDGLRLRAINACLAPLPTLDGKAVLTVEDLGRLAQQQTDAPAVALHPVQDALVRCHGSQCGFCTPGFAMTLTSLYEHHQARGTRPSRLELTDGLAGNLCRCTGYRPILEAGERMFDAPALRLDTAALRAALEQMASDAPLHYAGPNPAHTGADGQPRIDHFRAPRALADFAALRAARPQARLLAGATDVGLWINKLFRDLGEVHSINEVAELQTVTVTHGRLEIGAAVRLEPAWAALCQHWPELTELWRRFAAPTVRHAGTLAGNIANGSPIGDGGPALLALDAELVLRLGDAQRRLPLDSFYLGYLKNALQPGEFIERLSIPLPPAPPQDRPLLRAWKISKRHDSDISSLCGVFALTLDTPAGTPVVRDVRLAWGGLAATARRADQAEAALRGQPWTEATVEVAIAALAQDFQPLSDLRASRDYRLRVAGNLLRRLWLDSLGGSDPAASPGALSVWTVDVDALLAQDAGVAP